MLLLQPRLESGDAIWQGKPVLRAQKIVTTGSPRFAS